MKPLGKLFGTLKNQFIENRYPAPWTKVQFSCVVDRGILKRCRYAVYVFIDPSEIPNSRTVWFYLYDIEVFDFNRIMRSCA